MSIRMLATLVVLGLFAVASPVVAAAEEPLRLPFPEGLVEVLADETYDGGTVHPTNGAIAFDFVVPSGPAGYVDDVEVLAIGSGVARVLCVHRSGSAIVLQELDGGLGDVLYVHLADAAIPSRFDALHWERVEQGDVLGRLYPDRINGIVGEHCEQRSTGPHLHLDLPAEGMVLDGYAFGRAAPNNGDLLTSTNRVGGQFPIICDGLEATIVGSIGDDELRGTPGPDVIAARQGDDTIHGLEGDDVICAGRGNDVVYGGAGFDIVFGAQGDDVLFSASGSSPSLRADHRGARMFGGAGHDTLHGSTRWDRMQGGGGNDRLFGYEGRDWIRGGLGADLLSGGGSVDDLRGGPGQNDVRP